VTTWKINFRCALNGLKDIVERRDLEEADCRVYQMLPSSTPSRRRKRRRPGGFYLMDGEMVGQQGLDKDVRSRVELPAVSGPLIGAQTPTLSTGAILTPTSGGEWSFEFESFNPNTTGLWWKIIFTALLVVVGF